MSASANLSPTFSIGAAAQAMSLAATHQSADAAQAAFRQNRTLENGMVWLNAEIAHLQATGQESTNIGSFCSDGDLLTSIERIAMPLFSLRHYGQS